MADDTDLTDHELSVISQYVKSPDQLAQVMQRLRPEEQSRLQTIQATGGKSAASRLASGVAGALEGPIKFGYEALTSPIKTYEGLVENSSQNFQEAGRLLKEGDPIHALHHGIAAVIPPYGAVTGAADKIRAGDVAGGVGEAVGTGLIPSVYKGGIRLSNKTGTSLATNPNTQASANMAIGSAAGVMGSAQGGFSPFLGAMMGRNLLKGSEIPIRIGKALEMVTGGRAAGSPEGVAAPTEGSAAMDAETLTRLKRQGYSPEMIDRISRGDTGGVNAKARATARPTPLASHPTPPIVDTPSSGAFDEEWSDRLSSLDKRASEARHATAESGYAMKPQTSPEVQDLIETELNRVSKPSKVPIRDVPTTRSSSGLRAPGTPTLTVEDMNALGINPNMKITGLAPEAVKQMLVDRAKRAGVYKSSAELDALAKSIMDRDRP